MIFKKLEDKLGELYGKVSASIHRGIVFINLCPHPIYETISGLEIAEAIRPYRVYLDNSKEKLGDIPIITTSSSKQELPYPRIPGVYYVISALSARFTKYRDDILVPGNVVRDASGRLLGCEAFRRPDKE